MEQEKQQKPQETLQKKPPNGWQYYSPTSRLRWTLSSLRFWRFQILILTIGVLTIGVNFIVINRWVRGVDQHPWVFGVAVTLLIAMIPITFVSLRGWLGLGRDGQKTGLDLLQFLVTASIPILVTFGGIWFTEQRTQEQALEAYLESMGTLLIEQDLRTLPEDADARIVAQARTATVLQQLNATHSETVVAFLANAKLIQKENDQPIISLQEANLEGARFDFGYLYGAELRKVNFREAKLREADLREADLREADLSGAVLYRADLTEADLSYAKLSGAILLEADLTEADLSDVDLQEARGLTQEQLEETVGSIFTEVPRDLERPKSWSPRP